MMKTKTYCPLCIALLLAIAANCPPAHAAVTPKAEASEAAKGINTVSSKEQVVSPLSASDNNLLLELLGHDSLGSVRKELEELRKATNLLKSLDELIDAFGELGDTVDKLQKELDRSKNSPQEKNSPR